MCNLGNHPCWLGHVTSSPERKVSRASGNSESQVRQKNAHTCDSCYIQVPKRESVNHLRHALCTESAAPAPVRPRDTPANRTDALCRRRRPPPPNRFPLRFFRSWNNLQTEQLVTSFLHWGIIARLFYSVWQRHWLLLSSLNLIWSYERPFYTYMRCFLTFLRLLLLSSIYNVNAKLSIATASSTVVAIILLGCKIVRNQ